MVCSALLLGCQTGEEPEAELATSTTEQAVATSGVNYTFAAGSLIIPMDTTYQDQGVFLAYGLAYKLLQNKIPVSWVIKSGKRLSTIAATGGATSSGTTATFTTTSAHALAVGDRVTVRNVGVAGYNGTWTIASVPSSTVFTATITSSNLAASGGGTATPADFIASATDKQGGTAISSHGYRGGPFVIDLPDVAAATPIVDAWQAANPTTKVHVATTSFVGFVKRQLVAAPTIAQFDDGNAAIATAYMNAAKIPDSQGLAWTASSVDLLSPAEVAGSTCATLTATIAASPSGATSSGTTATFTTTGAHSFGVGYIVTIANVGAGYNGTWTIASVPSNTTFTVTTIASNLAASGGGTATMNNCHGTRHDDGKLFDVDGSPAYCQMMSMHWDIGDAATMVGREVIREYRRFLQYPTHLFAECQAVNAIENNTNPTVALAAAPNGATSSGTTATFTTTGAHLVKVGDSVLVAGVGIAGYNGTWVVTSTPSINQFTATVGTSGLGNSGGGTVATYNGLFLTTSGYLIGTAPGEVDSFNYDQPYAQYDGYFRDTGGSERSYSVPPGGGYKAQDVVMLTQRRSVPSTGLNDVWMTGFLDGQCNTTSEYCDPQFAQGKVSYLGGHDYGVGLPISNGGSQGTRLFLNALFEAPCATDVGVASVNLYKTAPTATASNSAAYTITAFNNGSSIAGSVMITDTLPAGVAFVPAMSQRSISAVSRAGNVVTVTTTAPHTFVVNDRVIVTGVTNAAFDGTFVVTAVVSSTQFRYAQVGGNASSSGGVVARGLDGVCAGTSGQCGGSGGGVVTFAIGSLGPTVSTTVTLNVQFQTAGVYANTAQGSFKAGTTTFNISSNTTRTCYYAGNPAVCASGADPNAPACANGADDDGDALIDFPDDPGCDSAVDSDENGGIATDDVKGRVLIVFDTSGSMMWNTCQDEFTGGDGSLACPGADVACSSCGTSGCGNGIADDSRLWKVKSGITNVVSGFGEVEWGLMRFKQLPTAFSCGTLNVNKNDGGWQGAGPSPCTGFDAGELVVKFDPESASSLLGWMDQSTNYTGTPPIGKDFELRASGNTPLAGSLASARSYIASTRSSDDPLVAGCRPYRIILVTDGGETCAGDPAAQAGLLFDTGDSDGRVPVHVIGFSTPDPQTQAQLNQIASQGGTTAFVPADDEAQLSAAIESIVQSTILVELCNDLDDDCDGKVDENFPDKGASCNNGAKGLCFRAGNRVCDTPVGFGTHCDAPPVTCSDLGSCTEVCNNLDDDCDGKVDEAPATNCQPCVPTGEVCNCRDDDCDGNTDENITRQCGTGACTGTETCVCSSPPSGFGFEGCTAQPSTTEECDGIDNDCDGVCDGLTVDCSDIVLPGGPGSDNPGHSSHDPIPQNICRPGSKTCAVLCDAVNGNSFDSCTGEIKPCNGVTPCIDPCNGVDDDCDNKIDEDFVAADCSTNCGVGTTTCTNGVVGCNSVPAMDDTTCNNLDEDCDNLIDEDWACDPSPTCTGSQCCACGTGTTCEQNQCINGVPTCVESPPISTETCNCLDDDCDSSTDEGTLCPGGSTCTNCQCAFACAGGEFPCPLGKKCEDGFCVNDPCFNATCPDVNGNKQTCIEDPNDPNDYVCVDACSVTTCNAPLVCHEPTGECKADDCTTYPERCTAAQSCIAGTCVTNPCIGVTCPAGSYCLGAACVSSCADITCPTGQRCRQGMCETDPCGRPCPFGEVCNDVTGMCIAEPCTFRQCAQGQWCNPNSGACEDDPCVINDVMCPSEGEICRGGTCDDATPIQPDAGTHVTVGGGGCRTTRDHGLVWLLVFVMIALRGRRGVR